MKRLVFISTFFITIIFCDTPKKYLFEINKNAIQTVDQDVFADFSIDGVSHIGTSSIREMNEFEALVENKEYKYKYINKFVSVISTNRRNDESRPDHAAQKLAGCIFTHYIDSVGNSDFVEGNNDIANEMIDQMDEEGGGMSISFGVNQENYFFPFSDTLRAEGETWYIVKKDEKTEDNESGMGSFIGTTSSIAEYTFKKIKEKKGDLIAYIDVDCTFESKGINRHWDHEYESTFTGTYSMEHRFNITKGVFVRSKDTMTIKGRGRNLETDRTSLFILTTDHKKKYKTKFKQ